MNFPSAVKSGFLNSFRFSGRATRPEYWYFTLFVVIGGLIGRVSDRLFGTYLPGAEPSTAFLPAGILALTVSVVVIAPHFTVGIRRMHDTNHSGWWFGGSVLSFCIASILVLVLPTVGMVAVVVSVFLLLMLLFLLCKAGTTSEPNRFGAPAASVIFSPAPE